MKDKYEGCYIDGYNGHYAVFADNGEKLAEYDTHKEANPIFLRIHLLLVTDLPFVRLNS